MARSTVVRRFCALAFVALAAFINGCQLPGETTYVHNITYLERALIDSINQNGPGDRYIINKVKVHDEVEDWFTISLTTGNPFSVLSESGSGRIGAGAVVQFCGWGEFLDIAIYTEYPYLCKRGEGLVFGVTRYGWVHLYGTGEMSGTRISIKKPK